MKRLLAHGFFFTLFLFLVNPLPTNAAIDYSGDLSPANPNDWISSTYAYIGYTDTTDPGQVEINGGSLLSEHACLGYDSGTSGTVTVTGTGSTWTNSDELYIGDSGNGTLSITGGGTVSNNKGHIGNESDSVGAVTVDGTGSTWINTGYIEVGNYGSGTLHITNGGAVSSDSGFIGYEFDSTGVVTVDGAESTWTNNYYLDVGSFGSGTLSITGGGTVSNNYDGNIGFESDSTGIVTVDGDGSTWNNNDYLYVGNYGSGTLSITNGGLVSVAGALIIDDDNNGDGFINMSDSGMLALAGNADESLTAFFGLISGTDAIRWWDPDASGWNSLTSAVEGENYTLEYIEEGDLDGYTKLTVNAIEPEAGDANCDGRVDTDDATLMVANWLTGVNNSEVASWLMGDFNFDNKVDTDDSTLLVSNWLNGVNDDTETSAVPEPGCVALLLTLLATGLGVAMKKRR